MSKVICDICGTVYPDNATVCPICGYPRQDSEKVVLDDAEVQANTARTSGTYVKGGRFSTKNVKKRHRDEGVTELPRRAKKPEPVRKAEPPRNADAPETAPVQEQPGRSKASPALKATVAVLAIAVIGVGSYIGWRFYKGAAAYDRPSTVQTTNPSAPSEQTQQTETAPAATGVPCVGLSVSDESITFDGPGRAWLLSVVPVPEDTTQPIMYKSSDQKVATVNEQGRVSSVGPGEAVITITCGDSVRECKVICNFEGSATTATEANGQTEETTKPTEQPQNSHYHDSNWVMNNEYGDATLIIGEEFSLELTNDAGETAEVTWSADRDGIVSINGNTIKGESEGMVDVTATIDGKTFTCIVRVIESR